jgi:hypothetical protein
MAEAERNYNSLAHIYSGLMDVVYWKKQYPEMIGYASKFEEVAAAMQSDYIILRAKLAMGKALFFNKKFNESQAYFNEALKLSDQLEDDELLKDVYGMYSYLTLSRNGNVEEFDLYRQKIDSLTGLENKNTVTRATKELEARYQSEKKDNQIKLQSATIHEKQIWNYLFISVIAALCSIGFISFRGYRNKQKLLLQEKTLQQQQIRSVGKRKAIGSHAGCATGTR